ncbi:MAG: cytochrome o ubiquinol oxidase subunit IV [Ottowia sp.]|uniref:cytochrome o ubiquinol oxidase subunit IV n=1 Tax=Ottowia sp. TaxID=1898956 RepID=UPI0039E38818
MSTHDVHAGPAHGHADGHHHDDGPHSSFSSYIIGFFLSVVLTAIPFWLVMAGVISNRGTAVLALGAFAVVQILVHMVCFLHMNGKAEGGWTMLSTIFSVVFVAITIAGTLWVMFHMNTHMMPGHAEHAAGSAPAATQAPAAPHGHGGAATN